MKMNITDSAVAWYKNEMEIKAGDFVRFFVRLGGCSTVQSGFSLGVAKEQPKEAGSEVQQDGITFYVEREDMWYFDDHNLNIDVDEDGQTIDFQYE
ncbi:HesB/YadR/YfhF family protein [Fictibacillus sp. KIGAM418]|uniref:HesB/YadR/YfhF family protein n=1 Tax=Fictibacillus marinisediminis TaxID=2878389 RepID=A0A9X1XD04_9BACL|nr:HesB/YadR/YfhF family protein [Fictibacillus marinisediminis]MCK6257138.1 HesB/YadR/YfhF family protein [Fictibacillus marinisediminis]